MWKKWNAQFRGKKPYNSTTQLLLAVTKKEKKKRIKWSSLPMHVLFQIEWTQCLQQNKQLQSKNSLWIFWFALESLSTKYKTINSAFHRWRMQFFYGMFKCCSEQWKSSLQFDAEITFGMRSTNIIPPRKKNGNLISDKRETFIKNHVSIYYRNL